MEEESLRDEEKQYLLNLLRHDDREYQIQGVEFASQLMNQEDFQNAFKDQLNHVNGMELLAWLRQPSSRGPRRALDKYMTVPDGMSKEKREFQLKFPNQAWREPMSDKDRETWADRVQQFQTKLSFAALNGEFKKWEQQWFAFKDLLRSFYEIHAPGFWDSLSDDKSQGILDPTWRLALPLARKLSEVKRDQDWSRGYEDKMEFAGNWEEGEPKEPDNEKYMEGWNDAVEEIDRESRGW